MIKAIHSLKFEVIPEEIAALEALPLSTVTNELNQIAFETRGNLRVSTTGKIQYVFAPSFESEFVKNALANSTALVMRVGTNLLLICGKAIHLVLVTLIRISIGVLLIACLVSVVVLLIASIVRFFGDGDGGDAVSFDAGGGGGALESGGGLISNADHVFSAFCSISRYFIFDWLFDWYLVRSLFEPPGPRVGGLWSWFAPSYYLTPDPYYWYYYSSDYDPLSSDAVEPKKRDANAADKSAPDFLTVCYEFVFGGPNPNVNTVETYWKLIIQTIRQNDGVVIAEQLAPYTGEKDESEDWMIPIMIRFEGTPEITDTGNIVYVFPKFRRERTEPALPFLSQNDHVDGNQLRDLYRQSLVRQQKQLNRPQIAAVVPASYLEEQNIPFVSFDSAKLITPILLGFVELTGASYLWLNLWRFPFLSQYSGIVLFLVVYGALFFLVPALRGIFNNTRNVLIDDRNSKRFELREKLDSPNAALAEKLSEAGKIRFSAAP
ncbi:MAG: hypothetical protein K2Z81_17760, partial [Cyanobacteria bacterium]|nr:hypothetical protein [Cyanobacteriota bacterium]